jgi:hypothetical protein
MIWRAESISHLLWKLCIHDAVDIGQIPHNCLIYKHAYLHKITKL